MILREKSFIVLSFIIVFLTFSACMRTEEIPIDLSVYEEQLVVHCTLNPYDDDINLKLTRSFSRDKIYNLSESMLLVHDAEVRIINVESGESIFLEQEYDTLPYYSASANEFIIKPGVSYELAIQVEGFDPIQAQTKIPIQSAKWEETSIDSAKLEYYDGRLFEGVYALVDSIHDPFVVGYYIDEDENVLLNTSFPIYWYVDLGQGRRAVSMEWKTSGFQISLVTPCESLSKYAYMEYFYYWDESTKHSMSLLDSFNGILPEYTNVENGLGVFGSFLKQDIIYKP